MEVSLDKNGWHKKLQVWTFGSKAPDFNSLCPYFWTTVFCIIFSPFVAVVKYVLVAPIIWLAEGFEKFISLMDGLLGTINVEFCQPIYEKRIHDYVETMSDREAFNIYALLYDVYDWQGKCSRPSRAEIKHIWLGGATKSERVFKTYKTKLDLWISKTGSEWETILLREIKQAEERREEQYRQENEWEKRQEQRRKQVKQMFNAIAYYTKYLAYLMAGVVGVYALYFFSLLGLWIYESRHSIVNSVYSFVSWIGNAAVNYWDTALIYVGGAVALTAVIVFAIKLIIKCELFQISDRPNVVSKFLRKFGEGAYNVMSFFVMYAKAAKENYCPHINWKE